MSLQTYHQKRDFRQTPEPRGDIKKTRGKKSKAPGFSYVIQKHEARRLHYDFRLEVDGVLKSWAVPKGPSLDPKEKRLAVETEDHPVEYADFEGVIPKPGYGAGTVMLWDAGEWQTDGDAAQALRAGKLSFVLQGQRLKGRWTLVKMKGSRSSGKEWLLLKDDDDFADPDTDPTEKFTQSVLTERSMALIEREKSRTWNSSGGGNDSDKDTDEVDSPDKPERSGTTKSRKTAVETSDTGASASNRNSAQKSDGTKRKKSPPKKQKKARKEEEIDSTLEDLQSDPPGKSRTKKSGTGISAAIDVKRISGARKKSFPAELKPQLASLFKTVPRGEEWLHEIKYDGYRLLARKDKALRLLTRNGKDWTHKFPEIAQALESLPEVILDGEVVSLRDSGISSFEGLQNALSEGETDSLVFYVFDCPYLDGHDLSGMALRDRKEIVADLVAGLHQDRIRYSEHIAGEGELVYEHACTHRLEGVISKQADSTYQNSRTKTWRKIKCVQRQEFVIIGFTEPGGSRSGFGALLLGYYEKSKLRYAGKVGTGFNARQLKAMHKQLSALVRKTSPLAEPADETQVTWVRPTLVAEVEFTEWTGSNRLRHPAFLGLREDKDARSIVREAPRDAPTTAETAASGKKADTPTTARNRSSNGTAVNIAGVNLSNPDKVLYDSAGFTKQDVAEYYHQVADAMLPYIRNRPLTLVRCPQGHTHHCFYQKHLGEAFSDAVKPVAVDEKQGTGNYAFVESVQGLVELVQMGTLEIHAWGSKVDDVEKPDTVVFDMDPGEGISWEQIKQACLDVRDGLTELGLQSFLKTSGGKGLHVVVPLQRRHTWDENKPFAKAVAEQMVDMYPGQYVATISKAKRRGKIFVDYLRNGRGATAICNFSTRSRPNAPVAVPLSWDELDGLESSQTWRLDNITERLALKVDPWQGCNNVRQSLTQKIRRSIGLA